MAALKAGMPRAQQLETAGNFFTIAFFFFAPKPENGNLVYAVSSPLWHHSIWKNVKDPEALQKQIFRERAQGHSPC